MIDTLGHNYDKGCNHFSFSNEGGFMFGIKVNSLWFVGVDFDGPKQVYIFDKCPTSYYLD
jgi:ribosomal protein L5